MRIAMVSEHASPLAALGGVDAGGQNVHVAALAGELAADGHDVTVYTRRDNPFPPTEVRMPGGVTVVHVPAGPAESIGKDEMLPFMPAFGDWLTAHWRRVGPPDLVHAHFWMSGLAALRAAGTLGVPVVQTYHALGVTKKRYQGALDTSPPGRIGMERTIGETADLIIATCSDEVLELTAMGVHPAIVTVVPCGVDLALFAPPTSGMQDRAASFRRPLQMLAVGRLVERKGLDTVLRALAQLPGAELTIAGGPSADRLSADPEARRLLELAGDLGIGHRITMTGGVDHRRLPAMFHRADVVVCTPWYEPFGIVPLEAAASGRPVVGSAVGGLLDTIVDGVTGLLVPPRDADALAGALLGLRDDSARRRRMGDAARHRAENGYSWTSVARRTLAAYRTVVVRPGRRDRQVSGA